MDERLWPLIGFLAGFVVLIFGAALVPLLMKAVDRSSAPKEAGVPRAPMKMGKAVRWLGWLELVAFYMAIWHGDGAEWLVAGWLGFKVAAKWETWSNIIKVPGEGDVQDRMHWGTWILQRFLIGTIANIVAALIATGIGRGVITIFEISVRSANTVSSNGVPAVN